MLQTDDILATAAVHEAGHAVVRHRLGDRVEKVIVTNDFACTLSLYRPMMTRRDVVDEVAGLYAGWFAQCAIGLKRRGARGVSGECTVRRCFQSDAGQLEALLMLRRDWRVILKEGRTLARALVRQHRPEIEQLADLILRQSIMNARELDGFFRYGPRYVPGPEARLPVRLYCRHQIDRARDWWRNRRAAPPTPNWAEVLANNPEFATFVAMRLNQQGLGSKAPTANDDCVEIAG